MADITAVPETAATATPAAAPAAMEAQEVWQPPSQVGEAPKAKSGKGTGARKGGRLAPYDAKP